MSELEKTNLFNDVKIEFDGKECPIDGYVQVSDTLDCLDYTIPHVIFLDKIYVDKMLNNHSCGFRSVDITFNDDSIATYRYVDTYEDKIKMVLEFRNLK